MSGPDASDRRPHRRGFAEKSDEAHGAKRGRSNAQLANRSAGDRVVAAATVVLLLVLQRFWPRGPGALAAVVLRAAVPDPADSPRVISGVAG